MVSPTLFLPCRPRPVFSSMDRAMEGCIEMPSGPMSTATHGQAAPTNQHGHFCRHGDDGDDDDDATTARHGLNTTIPSQRSTFAGPGILQPVSSRIRQAASIGPERLPSPIPSIPPIPPPTPTVPLSRSARACTQSGWTPRTCHPPVMLSYPFPTCSPGPALHCAALRCTLHCHGPLHT